MPAPSADFVPPRRWGFAAAGAVASAAWLGAVLWLFDGAGPSEWVHDRPDVRALVAQCDSVPERAARAQCKRAVVEVLVAHFKRETRLAQH